MRDKNGHFLPGNTGGGRPRNNILLPVINYLDKQCLNNVKFLADIRNNTTIGLNYRLRAVEIMLKKTLPDYIMNENADSTGTNIIITEKEYNELQKIPAYKTLETQVDFVVIDDSEKDI